MKFFNCKYLIILPVILLLFSTSVYALDVTLEWDANSEEEVVGYSVYVKNFDDESYWHLEDVDGISTTTITFYGLSDDLNWCFVVTAYTDDNRESGYSNEACTDDYIEPEDNDGSGGGGGKGCFIGTCKE